ncbi:MAG: AAA family ATPase, partial [Anaerolineae bacterium]|nr:AAA family ATPase [Anaerolineae bacterium]
VTFGLPGAGKTYAAKLFEPFGFKMHDGDDDLPEDMREAINTQQPVNDEMRDRFFRRIIAHVGELVMVYPKVVVAQTFLKEKYRLQFLEQFPQAQFVLVVADERVREDRLVRRTNQPLEPNYTRRMVEMFERPNIPHQVIVNDSDGADDLLGQIEAVVQDR